MDIDPTNILDILFSEEGLLCCRLPDYSEDNPKIELPR